MGYTVISYHGFAIHKMLYWSCASIYHTKLYSAAEAHTVSKAKIMHVIDKNVEKTWYIENLKS